MNQSKYLPFLLIYSLIVFCIEVDVSVPSFPDMMRYFATSEEYIQLTLSMNFLGICISGFFYGALADAYGRRRIMLIGNGIFLLGSIGCMIAESIDVLIIARFIQGLGSSAAGIVVYAIIADYYDKDKSASFIGIMNSVLTATMAGAPLVGSIINEAMGWRANFITIAILCLFNFIILWLFLPETLNKQTPFRLFKMVGTYHRIFSNNRYMLYSLASALLLGVYMVFVASASFLYIEELGLDVITYGLHQGVVLGAFSLFSAFTGKLNQRFGMNTCMCWGAISFVTGSVILVALGIYFPYSPVAITLCMCTNSIGAALCFGSLSALAMETIPDAKGAAAAGTMSIREIVSAVCVGIGSFVYNGKLLPLAVLILVCQLMSSAMMIYGIRAYHPHLRKTKPVMTSHL
jgi:DHA1 family bicyclomycin/chloramphenicol resistance-like MFS transporter